MLKNREDCHRVQESISCIPSQIRKISLYSHRHYCDTGFTVLEVMMALMILVISLLAVYQSHSNSLFILSTTGNLWKAMSTIQSELLYWERSKDVPPVSISQGTFRENGEKLPGWRWLRSITNEVPLPGIEVRRVNYRLRWDEGIHERSYGADIYVRP